MVEGRTGKQIGPDNLFFEPFFTTKCRASGKGLGLFTVYDIVRSHRGNLFVDSSLGEGTTLTARLPVSGAAA